MLSIEGCISYDETRNKRKYNFGSLRKNYGAYTTSQKCRTAPLRLPAVRIFRFINDLFAMLIKKKGPPSRERDEFPPMLRCSRQALIQNSAHVQKTPMIACGNALLVTVLQRDL